MRTETIEVYLYDELSEEAKEKARQWWRDGETFDWIIREAGESLDEFCDLFSINYREINYDEPYRNNYTINLDDNIKELSGLRLAKYIWNNYSHKLFKGKYYSVESDKPLKHKRVKSEKLSNGKIFNAYYSAIQKENSCVFTGVCYDNDLLDPIYEFLKSPNTNRDFEALLDECILSLCNSVSKEIEWQNEDDQVANTIVANEYEFTADGERY